MRAVLSETRQAYDLFKYETSFDLAADDVSEICSLLACGSCLSMKTSAADYESFLRTSRKPANGSF